MASWSADVNNYRDIAQPLVQHLKVSKGGENGELPSLKLRKLLEKWMVASWKTTFSFWLLGLFSGDIC